MTQIAVFGHYHKLLSGSPQLKLLDTITSELIGSLQANQVSKFHKQLNQHPNFQAFMKVLHRLNLPLDKMIPLQNMFGLQKIIYHHIAAGVYFSIVALAIPAKQEFSLHNHPDMLVVTKVLSGRLIIESMDIDRAEQVQDETFKVINWRQKTLEAGDTSIVFPQMNNIHRIVAQTNCIFLDVLMPDYHDQSAVRYYEYAAEGQHMRIRSIQAPKEADQLIALSDILQ